MKWNGECCVRVFLSILMLKVRPTSTGDDQNTSERKRERERWRCGIANEKYLSLHQNFFSFYFVVVVFLLSDRTNKINNRAVFHNTDFYGRSSSFPLGCRCVFARPVWCFAVTPFHFAYANKILIVHRYTPRFWYTLFGDFVRFSIYSMWPLYSLSASFCVVTLSKISKMWVSEY